MLDRHHATAAGIYNNKQFRRHRPETAKKTTSNYKLNILGVQPANPSNLAFYKIRKTHKSNASHDTVPRLRSKERNEKQER